MPRDLRKGLKRWLVEGIARRQHRPRLSAAQVRALPLRRILVVRQHNQMGDMVCATPAFRALRAAWPGVELGLVCAPVNWEVVRNNPDLSRVFVFDKRRLQDLGRLQRELRAFRPDLALVLNSVSFSVTSVLIALASGAPHVVGGDSRPFGWDISRHLYACELPSQPDVDRPAVAHSLAPLAALGITTSDLRTVVVPAPAEEAAAVGLRAAAAGTGAAWLLHPGAGKRQNLWPAKSFAAMARRAAASGVPVLVLQGPADGPVLTAFAAALAGTPAAERERITILPRQSVGVCAALLGRADRFLCNDTGLMHVAGAVGTPTLALFGPTDPVLWKPPSAAVQALRAAGGRLEALDEAVVWEAWRRLPSRQAGTV